MFPPPCSHRQSCERAVARPYEVVHDVAVRDQEILTAVTCSQVLACSYQPPLTQASERARGPQDGGVVGTVKPSTVSTASLNVFRRLHARPINPVVFRGSQAMLILRWASRLDAFSGYPCRT